MSKEDEKAAADWVDENADAISGGYSNPYKAFLAGCDYKKEWAAKVADEYSKKPPAILRGHDPEVRASIRDEERGERIAAQCLSRYFRTGTW